MNVFQMKKKNIFRVVNSLSKLSGKIECVTLALMISIKQLLTDSLQ